MMTELTLYPGAERIMRNVALIADVLVQRAVRLTTRHRQLNIIIQRVPIVPGNPFDPFNSGPSEGAPAKVWARREDSAVRNEVEAGTGQLFAVNESPGTPCGRKRRRGPSGTPSSTRTASGVRSRAWPSFSSMGAWTGGCCNCW